MAKLAVEIPIPHLEELSALTDFDFILCDLFLENSDYRDFYIKQALGGREVWLDSMSNERGVATPVDKMLEAYNYLGPGLKAVTCPDIHGDITENLELAYEFLRKFDFPNRPLLVFVRHYEPTKYIFRPNYKEIYEYFDLIAYPACCRNELCNLGGHFLAFQSKADIILGEPLSIDTGAPIKYAMRYKEMDKYSKRIVSNEHFLKLKLDKEQLDIAKKNIHIMKEWCMDVDK